MIDVEPLIPILDAAHRAQHDLLASEAEWNALSKTQQRAQADAFLARDVVSKAAYDEACRQVTAALRDAVINYGETFILKHTQRELIEFRPR